MSYPRRQPIPLSSDQLEACRDAASRGRYESRFVFDVMPYTGLKKFEFLHLKEDWIIWGDGDALGENNIDVIDVPREDECINVNWDATPPETITKSGVCRDCREKNRDKFVSHGESADRQIPVAQPCAKLELRRWFRDLGHDGVPWDPRGLTRLVTQIGEQAGLDRTVKPMDLTLTFLLVAAERGNFNRDELAEMTHFYKRQGTFNNVLRQSTADFDFSLTVPDVLTCISRLQPTYISEIADHLDIHISTSHNWIHQLIQEGLIVEVADEAQNYHQSCNLYKLADGVDPEQSLPCPNENCNQTFLNFGTRTQHINHIHE